MVIGVNILYLTGGFDEKILNRSNCFDPHILDRMRQFA